MDDIVVILFFRIYQVQNIRRRKEEDKHMTKVDTPIKIGKFTIKNRITFAPTVKFDFTDDTGMVTSKLIDHYKERAEGGTGLICVEATAVLPGGRFGKNHMGLWNDSQMEGHKAITKDCHNAGAVVIIQLNHTGYVSNPECGPHIGPSELEMEGYRGKYITHSMSIDEIHNVQQAFVDAALRAQKAGYDGIQLHGCHGYLINQFVSAINNRRNDEYGGTADNRARFACEIIEKVREVCGPDFLISVRTTGMDPTVEDAIAVAEEYVAAGCDYLQVSSGMTSLNELPEYMNAGIDKLPSLGAYFKKYFQDKVPVSCVGGINTPEMVKYLIENEFVDTVDVGRAILADPRFANAAITGSEYVKCYGCKACQYGPFTAHQCPAEIVRNRK